MFPMALRIVILSSVVAVAGFFVARQIPESIELNPARPDPSGTMSAVCYNSNNSPITHVQNYPRPLLKNNQILVKVHASALNPVDYKLRRNPTGDWVVPKPKIPGCDLAGTVVQVGSSVTSFQVGDRVAAMLSIMGTRWGAAASYVAVNDNWAAKLPTADSSSTVSWEDAASLPLTSLTVLQALDYYLKPGRDNVEGKKILVQAGAGGVGTFAIQYAKHVLGMYVACTASGPKAEFLRELGADLVIDYTKQDFDKVAVDFDVVLDPMSWLYEQRTLNSRVLKPDGHYIGILSSDSAFDGQERAQGPGTALNFIRHKAYNSLVPGRIPKYDLTAVSPDGGKLQYVLDLLSQGKIKAVIDRTFPLRNTEEAMTHLKNGHSTGKVVLIHDV